MFTFPLLRFPLWSVLPLIVIYLALASFAYHADGSHHEALTTMGIFLTATWMWICTKVEETYIAVLAVFTLIVSGNLSEAHLYKVY